MWWRSVDLKEMRTVFRPERAERSGAAVVSEGAVWGTVVFTFVSTLNSALSDPMHLLTAIILGTGWVTIVEYIDRKHEEEDRREREG